MTANEVKLALERYIRKEWEVNPKRIEELCTGASIVLAEEFSNQMPKSLKMRGKRKAQLQLESWAAEVIDFELLGNGK